MGAAMTSMQVIVLVAFSLTLVIDSNNNLFSHRLGPILLAQANRQNGPQSQQQPTTFSSVTLSPGDSDPQSGPEFSLSSAPQLQQESHHRQSLVSPKNPQHARQSGDTINDIQIECNSDNIVVTLNTAHGFNGMIYPKGLSKNSTCMMEYHQTSSNITYYLPLRSCNTMSTDVEDGIEYFNTVMVQPHRRLVTNQGRGYHIKCRYQTKERTITNQEQQLNVNLNHSTPAVIGSASMPSCTMKIYSANDLSHEVAAENVRIGDELHLVIALDDQDVYGMLVTNCLVRDGMNWGEQPLIDDYGCPVDEDIMPQFNYAKNLTRASVTFQAHKFPYTSSVYYQCNVKLCFREQSCAHVPPNCDKPAQNNRPNSNSINTNTNNYKSIEGSNSIAGARNKRWIDGGELDAVASEEVLKYAANNPKAMSIEVFSGLHVDESSLSAAATANSDNENKDPIMMASTSEDPAVDEDSESAASVPAKPSSPQQQQANKRQSERDFCMSLRKFAIAISLASLLLMLAIIIMVACMIQRRKRRRIAEEAAQYNNHHHHQQHQYSNSGPYNNRAYLRD